MVPPEQLSNENFLYVYYIATEVKRELEIASVRYILEIPAFFQPNATKWPNYPCSIPTRKKALTYLSSLGLLQFFPRESSPTLSLRVASQEKFFQFCSNLAEMYNKRFSEPMKFVLGVRALTNEQIKQLAQIMEAIHFRLVTQSPPYIMYFPYKDFPQSIERFVLHGLLYKLANDFKVLSLGIPVKDELDIRFREESKQQFYYLKKAVDEKTAAITVEEKEEKAKQVEAGKEAIPSEIKRPIEVKLVQGSSVELLQKDENKYKFPHKLPRGTRWNSITIKFIDEDNVHISVKGKEHDESYEGMGFKGRANKPSVLWGFLRVLAAHNGGIPLTQPDVAEKFKKQKELLSEKLENYFGLDFSAFHDFKAEGKGLKSYRVKFNLYPPDGGFAFQKKETMKPDLLAKPEESDPYADLEEVMKEEMPVVTER